MRQFLALKASAGSGKTYALTLRYISLLFLDINPNSILTLTFTNKAAAEMAEFKKFLVKQNVVGLAVGLIVGTASGNLVKSLVENVINPIISQFMGSTDALAAWVIGPIMAGKFLGSLIDFVIMLGVVYFVINKAVKMIMGDDAEAK